MGGIVEIQTVIARALSNQRDQILSDWAAQLRSAGAGSTGRIKDAELETQCRNFLGALTQSGGATSDAALRPAKDLLAEISRTRAMQGFSPTETATFVFSLKQPLFDALMRELGDDAKKLAEGVWMVTTIIDGLGLHTMEVFQRSREEVVARQQREIAELSTPVVKLWDGVLALPLIGTLDSERTSVVMENLLQSLIDNSADFAIIDITGVPTVDTLVAQHLLKTVAAARLMGADCIISGIRPQIAQTMVHLGVELNVVSKATLADAFREALRQTGRTVTKIDQAKTATRIAG